MPSSFRQEETWWSRVLFPFFSAAILVPPSHGVAVVLAAFSRPCEVPVKLWLFYPFLCNVPPGVPSLGECAWALSLIEWPTLWLMESSPRQVFDPLPPPQGGPFLWELLAALSHPDPGGTFLSLGQRQMSLCLEAQCSLPQIWAVILLSSRHYTQLPIRQAFPLPADTQDPIILEIREEINLMSFSTALFDAQQQDANDGWNALQCTLSRGPPYGVSQLNPAALPFNPPSSVEVKPMAIQGANGEFNSWKKTKFSAILLSCCCCPLAEVGIFENDFWERKNAGNSISVLLATDPCPAYRQHLTLCNDPRTHNNRNGTTTNWSRIILLFVDKFSEKHTSHVYLANLWGDLSKTRPLLMNSRLRWVLSTEIGGHAWLFW